MSTSVEEKIDVLTTAVKSLAKLIRKMKNVQEDPDGLKAKERAKNNGFNRPLEVSTKLREFLEMGADETISRSEVTKRINVYVSTHGLKSPTNGRVILLDDNMRALLQPPAGLEITFLNIQKYLTPHYPAKKTAEVKVKTESRVAEIVAAIEDQPVPVVKKKVLVKKKVPLA